MHHTIISYHKDTRQRHMIKVIQYNIYFGDGSDQTDLRIDTICVYLNSLDADVLCLQEVLKYKYDSMIKNLAPTYPHVFPKSSKDFTMNYGTAIISKYPIVESITHMYKFTKMGRDLKIVLVQNSAGDKIHICTTHFESEFKDSVMAKTYQYNRCSDILQKIHAETSIPIILCADTNVCRQSEQQFFDVFSHENGWRDAWIEMGLPQNCKFTFDSTTNPILRSRYKNMQKSPHYRSRLDRIVHNSDLHCTTMQLIGDDSDVMLSDHYGIMCTFSSVRPPDRITYIQPIVQQQAHTQSKQVKPKKKMF